MSKRFSEGQVRRAIEGVTTLAAILIEFREANLRFARRPPTDDEGQDLATKFAILEPQLLEAIKGIRHQIAGDFAAFVRGEGRERYVPALTLFGGICERGIEYEAKQRSAALSKMEGG